MDQSPETKAADVEQMKKDAMLGMHVPPDKEKHVVLHSTMFRLHNEIARNVPKIIELIHKSRNANGFVVVGIAVDMVRNKLDSLYKTETEYNEALKISAPRPTLYHKASHEFDTLKETISNTFGSYIVEQFKTYN